MATLTVTLPISELIEQFRCADHGEVIDMIKAIDAQMQDWDFTLKLCDHFDGLRKEWEAEQAVEPK